MKSISYWIRYQLTTVFSPRVKFLLETEGSGGSDNYYERLESKTSLTGTARAHGFGVNLGWVKNQMFSNGKEKYYLDTGLRVLNKTVYPFVDSNALG